MANTLTNLIPTIFAAKDIVLRELTGFIPSVMLDANGEAVAKDQTIRWPVVAAESATDIAPAATGPDPADTTVSSDTMSISKSKSSTFYWTGEDQRGLGDLYNVILRNQFAQAMRVLVNEVESDLAALYKYAKSAYGTAGTAPFASDLSAAAQVRKLLADRGAPMSDLQMVINTSAGANLRTLGQLTKVNEAGVDQLLRRGVLLDLTGFAIRESAQVANHTTAAAGYLVDLTAGYAAATETFHVDTGTGAIVVGDVLANTKTARDTNKYVVETGATGDGDHDVTIHDPGIKVAWVNNDPLTFYSYAGNLAFAREAIACMLRVPAMPEGGDAADDVTVVTDEQTGISFQIAMYRQYRRVAFEVGLSWGVKAVKPDAMAILLG